MFLRNARLSTSQPEAIPHRVWNAKSGYRVSGLVQHVDWLTYPVDLYELRVRCLLQIGHLNARDTESILDDRTCNAL